MKSLAKAQATLRDVADKIKIRLPAKTIRAANDSAGWPMLFISGGSEAAGQSVIALRVKAVDMVSKDVFGNDTSAYSPHALEIAYELTATDNPIPSDSDLATVNLEAAKCGMKLQIKELANTTAVTAANMDAATAAPELEYDVQWPTKGQ